MSDLLDDKQFDELSIPFACTAVDLNSQKEVYLRRGNLLDAVLATSAFPGVLPPRQIGNALLVDGGVLDPVPVHLARTIAPNLPVLAIALQPSPEAWGTTPEANILDASPIPLPKGLLDNFNKLRLGQAMRIFSQSIEISTRMVAELRLAIDKPEYIIRPDVVRYAMFEMVNPDDLVEIGIKAAEEALDDLLKAQTLTGKVKHFIRTITPSEEPPILGPDPVLQEPME
ncbi:MAG: patatin-like phospholipase family protein [Anaerolineae bacterium]|nr:patatin-like phospholipase family protein [Anaerolineae bacterium]